MATILNQSAGVVNFASGTATGDGAADTATIGFTPRYIMIYNATDAIRWEKTDGMADANCIKTVTAGTTTTDATSAIVIGVDGFTMSAALHASGKSIFWVAMG